MKMVIRKWKSRLDHWEWTIENSQQTPKPQNLRPEILGFCDFEEGSLYEDILFLQRYCKKLFFDYIFKNSV